jgi:hypothetical protein
LVGQDTREEVGDIQKKKRNVPVLIFGFSIELTGPTILPFWGFRSCVRNGVFSFILR